MSTLILSSSGKFIASKNIEKYLPKKIRECKIAYIITASKSVPCDKYIVDRKKKMGEMNFNFEEIDIEGMNEEELREKLDGFDVVYVEGGNTFLLLKAVRESGFENVIRELLDKGVVYIGSSAGSYIACPSIILGDFQKNRFDKFGLTDFTGMNLVPLLIKAHYKQEDNLNLKTNFSNLGYPIRLLTDDQALLVKDGKVELLGGGDELII